MIVREITSELIPSVTDHVERRETKNAIKGTIGELRSSVRAVILQTRESQCRRRDLSLQRWDVSTYTRDHRSKFTEIFVFSLY